MNWCAGAEIRLHVVDIVRNIDVFTNFLRHFFKKPTVINTVNANGGTNTNHKLFLSFMLNKEISNLFFLGIGIYCQSYSLNNGIPPIFWTSPQIVMLIVGIK